jgi:SAM-dependent methyltransferase
MMVSPAARYEPFVAWYAEISQPWGTESAALLPEDLAGQRILDLACGQGALSRLLTERGALVTAVDLSPGMLAVAQANQAAQPFGVEYVLGDAATTDWWDGRPFDGVVCNMALMDIDDLDGTLLTVAHVLKSYGWFSFSVLHPCYPGERQEAIEILPSWPPDGGYTAEGWWNTNGSGVRGRVGANHRMLSTYLNTVVRAGFELVEFAEAAYPVPRYLMVRGVRKP